MNTMKTYVVLIRPANSTSFLKVFIHAESVVDATTCARTFYGVEPSMDVYEVE